MKTTILTAALILVLNASATASPTNTDLLLDFNVEQNISLDESLVSNANGRNKSASSQLISRHSVSTPMQSDIKSNTITSNKGRNLDFQSFALKQLKKAYEIQIAIHNL